MRFVLSMIVAAFAMLAQPALAHGDRHATTTIIIEEWVVVEGAGTERLVSMAPEIRQDALASYGPFRVVDRTRAQLVGVTDEWSPADFAAMMRDHPAIATLEMLDCPGTYDDRANLRLGRMIRAAGLATHVPAGGSVRSGAVELFLAGTSRRIDDGAEFAVHAWLDEDGYQATDYAITAPENRKYLAFYEEMGMSAADAQAFYAMTNSVSFEQAKWLDAAEMRRWVETEKRAVPQLAYLDLGALLH